ncbi:hypothetical protein VXQ18_14385 [Brucella abortus]|nr:hypothetical protein [Brucella abortus]
MGKEIRHGELKLPQRDIDVIESYFRMPDLPQRPEGWEILAVAQKADAEFASWVARNVTAHKHPSYRRRHHLASKPVGGIPGDASAEQMELVADVAQTCSFDEIRVSHEAEPRAATCGQRPICRQSTTACNRADW